jgi:hypothetical protein
MPRTALFPGIHATRSWHNLFDTEAGHPYITVQDSKHILLKNMASKRHTRLPWSHPVFARVLSLFLLGFIAYGTTVEAAHRHGQALNFAAPNHASSLSGASDESGPGIIGCSDCLICQLQQNFSTTVITHRQFDPPAAQSMQASRPTTPGFHSLLAAPRTGRAPPLTS